MSSELPAQKKRCRRRSSLSRYRKRHRTFSIDENVGAVDSGSEAPMREDKSIDSSWLAKFDGDVDRAIREGDLELRSECGGSSDDERNASDDPLDRLLATGKYFVQSEWNAGDEVVNDVSTMKVDGPSALSQKEKADTVSTIPESGKITWKPTSIVDGTLFTKRIRSMLRRAERDMEQQVPRLLLLQNSGNCCFLIAAINVLLNNPILIEYVDEVSVLYANQMHSGTFEEVRRRQQQETPLEGVFIAFIDLLKSSRMRQYPLGRQYGWERTMLMACDVCGVILGDGRQHDADEFLRIFFNALSAISIRVGKELVYLE